MFSYSLTLHELLSKSKYNPTFIPFFMAFSRVLFDSYVTIDFSQTICRQIAFQFYNLRSESL
ncbi:MAG: hypothetical protein Q4Q13_04905, partial [Vagococcus sp.]|nr:hypothetical protein [Vagococcus sp.]